MFRNILKIFFRTIVRHRAYSLIHLLGLSIGLSSVLIIMLWIQEEIGYDRFHENAEQLYRVAFTYRPLGLSRYHQPGALSGYLKKHFPEIRESTFVSGGKHKLNRNNEGFSETGLYVEPDFFTMFSFPILSGDPRHVFDNVNSIVITEKLANRLFGQSDPLGQIITMDDNRSLAVSGVLKDIPRNTQFDFDFLVPFDLIAPYTNNWNAKSGLVYILLDTENRVDDVNAKIAGIIDGIRPEWENTLFLAPLARDRLYPVYGRGSIHYIYLFSSVAVLILLIACINYMNLSTARSERRLKEIAIRQAMGSRRIQLILQFLGESLSYTVLAMIFSLLLVEISLPAVNQFLNVHLSTRYSWPLIGLYGLIILFTGAAAGSYPAFYLSSFTVQRAMTSARFKTGGHAAFRKISVIVQFGLSVLFMISLFVINEQMDFIRNMSLGFDQENVILLSAGNKIRDNLDSVRNRLLEHTGVQQVTVSSNDMTGWTNSGPVMWTGLDPDANIEVGYNWVDENYLNTFRMQMADGRFFSEQFLSDADDAFVVNEEAVRQMGMKNPVGQEISTWFGRKGRIIGVVKDYHTAALHEPLQPAVLMLAKHEPYQVNYLCVRIERGNVRQMLQDLHTIVREIVPDDPVSFKFQDAAIQAQYETDERVQHLIQFSSIFALIVSCLGLLGLSAFNVQQRSREIGVRKVLGATVPLIAGLMARDYFKWILLGNVIAWPAAWIAMHKWLENFSFRMEITIWSFLTAGLATMMIALMTIGYQVMKAAMANPVVSLRDE
ncbi:ABC transporter permease [bacterium]|nr:ABC transporter permease [bacterium]